MKHISSKYLVAIKKIAEYKSSFVPTKVFGDVNLARSLERNNLIVKIKPGFWMLTLRGQNAIEENNKF